MRSCSIIVIVGSDAKGKMQNKWNVKCYFYNICSTITATSPFHFQCWIKVDVWTWTFFKDKVVASYSSNFTAEEKGIFMLPFMLTCCIENMVLHTAHKGTHLKYTRITSNGNSWKWILYTNLNINFCLVSPYCLEFQIRVTNSNDYNVYIPKLHNNTHTSVCFVDSVRPSLYIHDVAICP